MSKTALITGASGGIGLELAKLFAKDKINLLLVARSGNKLAALAGSFEQQYGITAKWLATDLTAATAAQEVFDYCRNNQLSVDYLVNNAGFGDFGFFAESDWTKQLQMINLNITTLTHLTRLFLPGMIEKRFGKIMNVASTAAFQPGPTMSVYYATKAYVLSFSEAISNELEKKGVTVTALCPGATESGFQQAAAMEESRLVKGKKLPSSEEVAEYGYKAMMRGKVVAIEGWKNAALVFSTRFSPRWMVRKIVRSMQDKAK
jgi:short-subunit dehydrogenase